MAGKERKNKKLRIELIRQILSLATAGFGVVAALAWNNVIQELVNNYIKKFIPGNAGIVSLLIYALVVTILAVTVTFQLSKILERLKD